MPGKGNLVGRPYTAEELATFREGLADLGLTLEQLTACLGDTCLDVYFNEFACWRCVPERVWTYTIGGYQVIKKWLSYRERPLLDRDLTVDEARYVTEMVRRIAAILLLEPDRCQLRGGQSQYLPLAAGKRQCEIGRLRS